MREVRHINGTRTTADAPLAQFAYRTPRSEVIHVHVKRQSVLKAIRPAKIHYEVHSSVSADLLGYLSDLPPERMAVFFAVAFRLRFRHERVDAGRGFRVVYEKLVHRRVVVVRAPRHPPERPPRTGKEVDPRVWTRTRHVMLYLDGPSAHRLDQRHVHVSHGDALAAPPILRRIMVAGELLESGLLRLQRHEVIKAIAPVYAH